MAVAMAAVVVAALGLSACGRKGPLDLPPSAAAAPPVSASPTASAYPNEASSAGAAHEAAIKNGFDAHGNPVAPAGQNRPFLLDPLLQ
jgi:predicted small lipoprotein YifL